jgi:hypothetical protein
VSVERFYYLTKLGLEDSGWEAFGGLGFVGLDVLFLRVMNFRSIFKAFELFFHEDGRALRFDNIAIIEWILFNFMFA